MKKRSLPSNAPSAWHILAIVAVCLAVYGNALTGSFVWDDELQIVKNGLIRSFANVGTAFTSAFWDFADPKKSTQTNFYRPIQTLSYMAGYRVGKLSPAPYHAISLLFHAAASVFVYLACFELSLTATSALLAAFLFAVHPVHSEPVAWIAGIPDVACGAFYFAALWSFLRYYRTNARKWLWLSSAAFLCGLLAKEMAVTLPLVIVILLRFRRNRGESGEKIALPVVACVSVLTVYLTLRYLALGLIATSHFNIEAAVVDWITLGVQVIVKYLQYSVFPYPLSAYHLMPLKLDYRVTPALVSLMLILILALVLIRFRGRVQPYGYWLLVFLVMLIPVLYFKGISMVFFAERYLYIPIFSIVLLGVTASETIKNPQLRFALWSVALIFSFVSIKRNSDWANSERLYTKTLVTDPDAAHIRINLAEIFIKRSDDAAARAHLEKALASFESGRYIDWPYEQHRAYVGLGAIAARSQDYPAAKRYLEKAIAIYQNGDWGYLYLGGVLLEGDRDYPGAIAYFRKAIELGPLNEMARDYLGIALLNLKNYREAARYFEEALRINPNYEPARVHLTAAQQALTVSH